MRFRLALAAAIGLATSGQTPDTPGMMARIRTEVESKLPGFTYEFGNVFAEHEPPVVEGFVLRWRAENDFLNVSCDQYTSADDAIRRLRGLRWELSAGVPQPLPGVADEAYFLNAFSHSIYFARRRYVCQGGSLHSATTARTLMDIVIAQIDSAASLRS
jgi:hypothetical protein